MWGIFLGGFLVVISRILYDGDCIFCKDSRILSGTNMEHILFLHN